MDATAWGTEPLALIGRLTRLRQNLGKTIELASPWPLQLRDSLQQVVAEADAVAIEPALNRLIALTEIWECSAGNSDHCPPADEAWFVEEALDRLIDGLSAGTGPDAMRWVISESERHWAEYLRLLEPVAQEAEIQEPSWASPPTEEPPAIGTDQLLRLLAGDVTSRSPFDAPADPQRADAQKPDSMSSSDVEPLEQAHALPLPADLPNDLREAFLAEAAEISERLQDLLFQLPRGDVTGVAREIGRSLHTLKGAAGSIGLTELAGVVHDLEQKIDSHAAAGPGPVGTYLESGLNRLDAWLGALRQARPGAHTGPSDAGPAAEPALAVAGSGAEFTSEVEVVAESESTLRVATDRIDALSDLVQEIVSRGGFWDQQAQLMRKLVADFHAFHGALTASIERLEDVVGSSPRPGCDRSGLAAVARGLKERCSDLGMLAAQLRSAALSQGDEFEYARRTCSQLWATLQAIRVVPVRGLLQRLARVARDAANVEGRRIEVELIGDIHPLDRAIQERAFQPLLHVVRNAVGHGIEPDTERSRLGKSPIGHVRIAAYPRGHQLVFEVEDDGRGLDDGAIEAKARRLGLLGADEHPTSAQLHALVFRPGFSTREQANTIAGRGVGLDAALNEIRRMRGSLELASRRHEGTRVSVHVPTRLALAQMLIVKVDGQLFGIPLDLIEAVAGTEAGVPAPAATHPDRPPVRTACVRSALGLSRSVAPACPRLVIAHGLNETTALGVDSIEGIQELVVKPLPALVRDHPAFSGTCLTMLGETVLVLNPEGLGRLAGRPLPGPQPHGQKGPAELSALVVDDSLSARTASVRMLRDLGFRVDEAADGDEALACLRRGSYRLLVTDLEMPRRDGFELLSELQRGRLAGSMKILAISSRADPATEARVARLGAHAFLAKPAQPDRMARTVHALNLLENEP